MNEPVGFADALSHCGDVDSVDFCELLRSDEAAFDPSPFVQPRGHELKPTPLCGLNQVCRLHLFLDHANGGKLKIFETRPLEECSRVPKNSIKVYVASCAPMVMHLIARLSLGRPASRHKIWERDVQAASPLLSAQVFSAAGRVCTREGVAQEHTFGCPCQTILVPLQLQGRPVEFLPQLDRELGVAEVSLALGGHDVKVPPPLPGKRLDNKLYIYICKYVFVGDGKKGQGLRRATKRP